MIRIATLLTVLCAITGFAQNIELREIASGFSAPLNIQNAGDERLFVVERGGLIKIVNSDGSVNPAPFLNIAGRVTAGGERGLLGLAFHPDYETNGYFYVYYINTSNKTQISRFSVSGNDADIADPASEFPLLNINQPYNNHNGGCIAFGPDGYLYISSGDGGDGGDPQDRAQKTNNFWGKLLRIDVNNGSPYSIPETNPFFGQTDKTQEIWAYGLRNVWKFSFDQNTGDLWSGDVGQGAWEEINKAAPDAAGLNYGWRCYEGTNTYNTNGCPPASSMFFPVAEYSHSNDGLFKCSVTGGYVYRGSQFSEMVGTYFFADFCSDEIGMLKADGSENYAITYTGPFTGNALSSFGEDQNGELFVVGLNSGKLFQVVDADDLGMDQVTTGTLAIYPNPVTNNLTVVGLPEFPVNLSVYNITGQRLFQAKVSKSTPDVATENLRSGIYLADFSQESTFHKTLRFIVK